MYLPPMVRYDTYRATAAAAPLLRRWIVLGLAASLSLHAGLVVWFYHRPVEGFRLDSEKLAPPRVFHMKQVSIPDAPPEEQRMVLPEKAKNLSLPSEKPVLNEVRMAPQAMELPKPSFAEKPKADLAPMEMSKLEANSRNAMDKELNTISRSFLQESPRAPRQPVVSASSGRAGGGPGEGDANISVPGLASVDDLLSQAGALRAGEKAAMPGGALFEYDQYALLPDSVEALKKLALLIQHNPRATFSIEGHSDSFGPPDYNQKLSEKRAEAVKAWLVEAMGITPERVQTRGYGNAKPIVSPDHTKEEQAPNRRVEIVVKTNGPRR